MIEMSPKIEKVHSRWVLDARGLPTIETRIKSGDYEEFASVPSGASISKEEAAKAHDMGTKFMGHHVERAIENVNNTLAPEIEGMDVFDQEGIDQKMIELDGTEKKTNLGANSILSVSLAALKTAACIKGEKNYAYIRQLLKKENDKYLIPLPITDLISGGKMHAGTELAMQEIVLMPTGAKHIDEAIRMSVEIYQTLKSIIKNRYGKSATNTTHMGTFAPNLKTTSTVIQLVISAARSIGYESKIKLGFDASASNFYSEGKYHLDGLHKDKGEMIDYYLDLIKQYPIAFIEDPFKQGDFESFSNLLANLPKDILLVGDDLTATSKKRMQRAVESKSTNAVLMKMDQVGTVTESLEFYTESVKKDMAVIVSHRYGETSDPFIADLSVAISNGFLKAGAPARSDKTEKYNELLRIKDNLKDRSRYPSNFRDYRDFI